MSKTIKAVPGIDKWKAEEDARILAEAAVIRSDKKRFEAAGRAAKEMGERKMVEAKALVGLGKMKKRG